jgi:serine protease
LFGNDESCSVAAPITGAYYINITAYSSFSGVSLIASYASGGTSPAKVLQNGVAVNDLSGANGSQQYFEIELPTAASNLDINISGGSGDADLYVRHGTQPTSSSYDCRPYIGGNDESCSFSSPQSGIYYIMLDAYSTYSGVTLNASYTVNGDSGSNSGATWSGFEAYYADAIGQTGNNLLSALAEAAARNHNRMTYSQVWSALKYTDEDPANSNNVILIYTGRSQAKTFNASGNNDPNAWNREHCWPKSHGFPSSGDWAYTDIHHLRPADASVNSTRSNKDYDNGGSAISEAPGNSTDSDSFEPRNAMKGDIARMMFYMHVRYNGGDNTGTDDLALVNYTGTSNANLGKLCTLVSWHDQDPVSAEEIARHARIVERQGNRNPFVDYPAWVDEVFGAYCD